MPLRLSQKDLELESQRVSIHTVFPFASTEAIVEILDNMIKRIRENQLEAHTKNNNDARVHQ